MCFYFMCQEAQRFEEKKKKKVFSCCTSHSKCSQKPGDLGSSKNFTLPLGLSSYFMRNHVINEQSRMKQILLNASCDFL